MGAHKGILLLASGWSLSVFQFQFQSGDSDRNFSSERALAIQRLTPRALHRRTAPGGGLWGAGGLTAPPHTRSGGRTSPPMSAHKHTCTRVHDRPGCRKCKIPREPPAPRRRAPSKTLARAGSLRAASGRSLKTLGQNFFSWQRERAPVAPHFLQHSLGAKRRLHAARACCRESRAEAPRARAAGGSRPCPLAAQRLHIPRCRGGRRRAGEAPGWEGAGGAEARCTFPFAEGARHLP